MSADTEDVLEAQDERTALKARADLLGISYHPSIGLEKLREKVNKAMTSSQEEEGDEPAETHIGETEGQRRKRLKKSKQNYRT